MKHPFWIVNSTLLLLVMIGLLAIYISRVRIPLREDVEPEHFTHIAKDQKPQINIAAIYENDIFETHVKEPELTEEEPQFIVPEPPPAQATIIPEIAPVKFLDPLSITLKGIITSSSDFNKNSAIIANSKGQEVVYKIGDTIEDAQIIRILSNKITLIRSNGQQEVLYLREQDAKNDPAYLIIDDWSTIAQKINDITYMVDPMALATRVKDVAYLIDLLNITSAYKDGMSIGSRIGPVHPGSLGAQLGLRTGDIVLSINGIPATTTENRLKIYHAVIKTPAQGKIAIKILRNSNETTLTYSLFEFQLPSLATQTAEQSNNQKIELQKLQEKEKINILKEKYKFAPTLQELRDREKQNMLHKKPLAQ